MKKIFEWIKEHKLNSALIVLVVLLLYILGEKSNSGYNQNTPYRFSPATKMSRTVGIAPPSADGSADSSIADTSGSAASERKVVTQSNVSLLVKNVENFSKTVKEKIEADGGFVVNSSVNNLEGGSTGYITIRIPSKNLEIFLDFLSKQAVRVVSKNISGYDITDAYKDIQARLDVLYKTKAIYDGLLNKTANIDEILRIQQMILNVQDQIDAYKGQLKYMDAASQTTLITINLAIDELALPYAPQQPWSPQTIFKQAVRSLVGTLREFASLLIWVGVYSLVWVPIVIAVIIIKRLRSAKK